MPPSEQYLWLSRQNYGSLESFIRENSQFNPNDFDAKQKNYFQYAIELNNIDFIWLFVKYGGDINFVNPHTSVTLLHLCLLYRRYTLLDEILHEHLHDLGKLKKPLLSHIAKINTLYLRPGFEDPLEDRDFKEMSPLMLAVALNDLTTVKRLIEEYNFDLYQVNSRAEHALFFAIEYESFDILLFIIKFLHQDHNIQGITNLFKTRNSHGESLLTFFVRKSTSSDVFMELINLFMKIPDKVIQDQCLEDHNNISVFEIIFSKHCPTLTYGMKYLCDSIKNKYKIKYPYKRYLKKSFYSLISDNSIDKLQDFILWFPDIAKELIFKRFNFPSLGKVSPLELVIINQPNLDMLNAMMPLLTDSQKVKKILIQLDIMNLSEEIRACLMINNLFITNKKLFFRQEVDSSKKQPYLKYSKKG